MKKYLLITLTLCLTATISFTQEVFQKSVGGEGNDFATSIAQTSDGGFVLAGDTYSFGLSRSDIYVVKFDSHGNLLWQKRYGGNDYDHANCITATSDGGCAVGGVSGGNSNSLVMLKIDASGNLEWSKFYSANTRHSISSIAQTPEGGYVLGGSASTYNNGSWGYIVKTDAEGGLEWSKLLFDRSFYPGVQKLVVTRDSGFAVVVNQTTTNAYYDIYLIKLKKEGSFQWARSIGEASTDFPSDLVQTSDGGYAVSGSTFDISGNPQYSFMYVFKTDSVGNFKFAKRIKGTNSDLCRTIAETNDRQLVISGSIPSPGGMVRNVFLTKIDTTGNVLWTKILANDVTASEAWDLIHTADSGYAAAGLIGNSGLGDFLLAKFDTGLNICGTVPAVRDDSDFGKPVIQTVKVSNVSTVVSNSSYQLIEAGGLYAGICEVMPVKLVSFTATKKENAVLLEWVTTEEVNTRSFEVYRSGDGINYQLLTTVAAHGVQGQQTKYNYTDAQPAGGKNFYKLRSVDKDGRSVFSEVRTIEFIAALIKIVPNPAKDWLNIELNNITSDLQLQVYSTDGKLVLEKTVRNIAGSSRQQFDIRNLKAGTYIVRVTGGNANMQVLFVKI